MKINYNILEQYTSLMYVMRMKLNFTTNRMLIYDVDITHQMINLKLKIMHSRKHKNPKKKEI